MTEEQKVEKLRSIVGKKIAIWCEYENDAEELLPLLNSATEEDEEISYWDNNRDCSAYSIPERNLWIVRYIEQLTNKCYKIIRYSEFFEEDKIETKDEVNDKPLKDWTIGEIKEHCSNIILCSDIFGDESNIKCKFEKNGACMFNIDGEYKSDPEDWDLSDKAKIILTQSEIDILKAIKVLYHDVETIEYDADSESFVIDNGRATVVESKFPTLLKLKMKEYSIDDLLKEGE